MLINTNAGYIFDQLQFLLQNLTDEQYMRSPEIFSGASVGKHYRHIIEFFQCVAFSGATDTICYDNRARDISIENNRQVAAGLLAELKQELAEIDSSHKLTLIGNLASGEDATDAYIGTTLFREFHYAVEHAIHHMAIIKMGISQAFPGVKMPVDFGVAPSTLRYQQATAGRSA
ncbi:MAG: DinB family protein [Chitinophagales bacterium]|nr:DinB family protein [Chitinophagales bacterium]